MKFDSPAIKNGYGGSSNGIDMNAETISDLVNERRPGSLHNQRPDAVIANLNFNRNSQ